VAYEEEWKKRDKKLCV